VTKSRDIIVGIATSYGLDDSGVGVLSPSGVKNFLFASSRPALRFTQLAFQWAPGAVSPGVKRSVREADHSPTASAEVEKIWIYISTHSYAIMA
jgi:hypothetical protein